MAWALAKNDSIIDYGKFENTIEDLRAPYFSSQKRRFVKEFKSLIKPLKTGDHIIAERFSVRGFNPGAQVEVVGTMLGMMAVLAPVDYRLIMAVQWKSHITRNYTDLNELNKKLRAKNKKLPAAKRSKLYKFEMEDFLDGSKYAKEEHICDAIGIGQWFYEDSTGKQSKFLKKWSRT